MPPHCEVSLSEASASGSECLLCCLAANAAMPFVATMMALYPMQPAWLQLARHIGDQVLWLRLCPWIMPVSS